MTYNVFGGTLNLTQSINQSTVDSLSFFTSWLIDCCGPRYEFFSCLSCASADFSEVQLVLLSVNLLDCLSLFFELHCATINSHDDSLVCYTLACVPSSADICPADKIKQILLIKLLLLGLLNGKLVSR